MRGTDRLNGPLAGKATWLAMRFFGKYSQRIGGYFAARLWFTPWRVQLSDHARRREALWLADTEPFEVEVDRGKIRGFSAGGGPAVLLMHGWGERASTMGAFIAPLTRAGYRVVGIDLPGHGATTVGETNFFITADALRAVAFEVGPVHAVIAHSMGTVATAVALEQGLLTNKVVFLAAPARLEHGFEKFNFMYGVPPRAADGLAAYLERHFGADIWRELAVDRMAAGFDVPALIVHDEGDDQVDIAQGELLSEAWRGSRFIRTQGLNHTKVVRDEEVIGFVTDFLRREPIEEVARPSRMERPRGGAAAGRDMSKEAVRA